MADSVSTKISEGTGMPKWPCRLPPARSWSSKVAETRWLDRRPKARWRWPWGEPKENYHWIDDENRTDSQSEKLVSITGHIDSLRLFKNWLMHLRVRFLKYNCKSNFGQVFIGAWIVQHKTPYNSHIFNELVCRVITLMRFELLTFWPKSDDLPTCLEKRFN